MFESPKFITSGISVVFERQREIRKKQFDFEDALKDRYVQPQLISVPDDLDPEVPRLIFTSHHGYSQIVMTQINISMNVKYSEEWQLDIQKFGKPYMSERIQLLFKLLSIVQPDLKANYCGANIRAQLPFTGDDEELKKVILEKYCNPLKNGTNLYDLSLSIVRHIDGKYFNNLNISNYRTWKVDNRGKLNKFKAIDATKRGLELSVDYNDRLAFNNEDEYFSSEKTLYDILDRGVVELLKEIEFARS
jgi:hypothetical protein